MLDRMISFHSSCVATSTEPGMRAVFLEAVLLGNPRRIYWIMASADPCIELEILLNDACSASLCSGSRIAASG